MTARSERRKDKRASATPRLLSKAPWIVALACVLLGLLVYRTPAAKRSRALAPPRADFRVRIPREPPVELLELPNSGFPCEVERVLKLKCRRCHTVRSRHGAPFALLSWQETRRQRHGQPVYQLIGRSVENGSMPFRIPA